MYRLDSIEFREVRSGGAKDTRRGLYAWALVGLLVGGSVSCETAPRAEIIDAEGTAYTWGNLVKVIDVPLYEAFLATKTTLRELQLRKTNIDRDGFTGQFEYLDREGKPIRVHLEKLTRTQTELSIHVGLLGDRKQSALLLEEIEARMPLSTPVPVSGWDQPPTR